MLNNQPCYLGIHQGGELRLFQFAIILAFSSRGGTRNQERGVILCGVPKRV